MNKALLTLLFVLATLAPARAEKITFVSTEFPPFVIKLENEVSGIEVDVLRELCRRLDLQPDIQIVPWSRALNYVKAGKVDGIFAPVYTKDRTEYIYFTEEPVGKERIAIMSLRGAGIKATSLDDIKSEIVGVVSGYSYGKQFDGRADLLKDVSYDNELLLRKLLFKRYRLIVSEEAVIQHVAKLAGQPPLEVVLVLEENPQFIGFSKTLGKKGEALAARFSQALRQMHQDGTYSSIELKYLNR